MKFAYKFSNLLGSVYRKGNVLFSPDGNTVISPVGNKVTLFDLKNNKSKTLPLECRYNILTMALTSNGRLLMVVDEGGEASLISLASRTVLNKYHFDRRVRDIKFSPDGKHYAVTKENQVIMFKTPGHLSREFNPFIMEKYFKGAHEETTCLDWSPDSKILAVGSKDMTTRLYAIGNYKNLIVYSLGGHSDSIVGCYFEHDSYDMITVSRNGQVCVWLCNISTDGLIPRKKEQEKLTDNDEEDSITEKTVETVVAESSESRGDSQFYYNRHARHYLSDLVERSVTLTSSAYHKHTRILVSGFSNGSFFLHEMPDYNLIHSLSMKDEYISAIAFNNTGDWIALGSRISGQLVVWEWQSESYIMKQQGHLHSMNCLTYSPDGQTIATGGDDSKVKLWNTSSSFCFVTFTEHQASVTGVVFDHTGKVVVSSSCDGTVRAFDLHRYRNFRTFTSPRPTQFSCVAIDPSGEFVCSGAQDVFEVFVWSVKNGRLLEVLSGHEGPVYSVAFSPTKTMLASASWDKNLKIWDVFENKNCRETINLNSDALAVTFRPDGEEVAILTLDSQITFFNVQTVDQTGSIEGKNDLGLSGKDTDLVTSKQTLKGRSFTTICYSADGKCMLVGGQSKFVCIYNIAEHMLMKKFELTKNQSLDGVTSSFDRRKMTEFGNLALVENRDDDDESAVSISLPGVRKGDMASRAFRPEIRVSCVRFSPTGRSWAATTTEGLLVFSLDTGLVFDPFELEMDVTPSSIRNKIREKEYSAALVESLKLNEQNIIKEVVEQIPSSNIDLVARTLGSSYVDRFLSFLASNLENSRHLEFYLLWINSLLFCHGSQLKSRSMEVMALLRHLQKSLTNRYKDLRTVCDKNKYSISYILSLASLKRKLADEVGMELDDSEKEKEDSRMESEDSLLDEDDSKMDDDRQGMNSDSSE